MRGERFWFRMKLVGVMLSVQVEIESTRFAH